jgi:hypothetical protein
VDLRANKVIREIKTLYEPVKYVYPQDVSRYEKALYKHFKRKFYNDTSAMYIFKKNLLVFTSTINDRGGILVHVFNDQGKLRDAFYLKIPLIKSRKEWQETRFSITGNHLWASHTDEDDNTVVVKYKFHL